MRQSLKLEEVLDHYDILVIGSGEAGKYLAWTMAQAGHRTALIERRLIGGSCPNVACLPSKNIIHSAKVASFMKRAAEFGLTRSSLTTDMEGVRRRKQQMVDGLVDLHLERFKATGVELIMGEARFIADRTIEVRLNDGGTRLVTGAKIFLNLGTYATIPDVPGLAAAKPLTHIEALDLNRLPSHLLVLGAGYIGLEFAQAMRRFGSEVTLIDRGSWLARSEDPDVSEAMANLFSDEGITVLLNTTLQNVSGQSGREVRLKLADRELVGTDILVAAGRTPNTSSVGLDLAGVLLDDRGYIRVNERLETTAPNIWALGECAGTPQFTHAAYDDFRIVRDNLRGGDRSTHGRLIPYCLFTDPELVRIGLNETEARQKGISYRLATLPMSAVLRTRTVSEPRGFMKMLIDLKSDRLLGFTAFGVEASELLAAVQTAMLGDLPYTVLRDGIFTHPTISEGLVFLLAHVEAVGITASHRR